MSSEAKVHIIDDDAAVRDALQELVVSAGLRAAVYGSAEEFLSGDLPERGGCLVLDIRMAGLSGLDLQQELAARQVDLPVIIVTGHGDVPAATRAFKQGALDFVQKPFEPLQLLNAVQVALARYERMQQVSELRATVAARTACLSGRERQVLELVMAGLANKQIAARLGVAERTVEFHRTHLMEKMGVASVAHLVRMMVGAAGEGSASQLLRDPMEKRN